MEVDGFTLIDHEPQTLHVPFDTDRNCSTPDTEPMEPASSSDEEEEDDEPVPEEAVGAEPEPMRVSGSALEVTSEATVVADPVSAELKLAVEQVVEGICDKVVEKLTQAKAKGSIRSIPKSVGVSSKEKGSKPASPALWPWLTALLVLGVVRIVVEASLTSINKPTPSLRAEFVSLPSERHTHSAQQPEHKHATPPILQPWFDMSGQTLSAEPTAVVVEAASRSGPNLSAGGVSVHGEVYTYGNVTPLRQQHGRGKRSPTRRSAELVQKLLAAPGAILSRPFKREPMKLHLGGTAGGKLRLPWSPPLHKLYNAAAVVNDYIAPPHTKEEWKEEWARGDASKPRQDQSRSLALARLTAFSPWYSAPWYSAPRDAAPQPPHHEPLPMTSSEAAAGEGEFALMPYRGLIEFQAQIQMEAAAKLKAQRLRAQAIHEELRSLGGLPAREIARSFEIVRSFEMARDASVDEAVATAVAKAVATAVTKEVAKAERGLEELKAQLTAKDKLLRQSQDELTRAVDQLSRARTLLRAKEHALQQSESSLDDSTRGEARAVATLQHVKKQRERSEFALAACSRGSVEKEKSIKLLTSQLSTRTSEKDKSLKHLQKELRVAQKALQRSKKGKGGDAKSKPHQLTGGHHRQHKAHGGAPHKKGWHKKGRAKEGRNQQPGGGRHKVGGGGGAVHRDEIRGQDHRARTRARAPPRSYGIDDVTGARRTARNTTGMAHGLDGVERKWRPPAPPPRPPPANVSSKSSIEKILGWHIIDSGSVFPTRR